MNYSTTRSPKGLPPGPRGLPLFGSLLDVRHDTHLAIDRLARRYGDICLLHFGSVPTVIINDPDLLQEAFGKTELADRWVSEIMDILSEQKDLVMAPYGEHWRRMQRFANRELLSARNLDNVRERYIETVVNDLVEQMGRAGDAGTLVSPIELTARSNSTLMFRSIFGQEEGSGGDFLELRDELLDHVNWIFANANAANLADYIPWLRFLPNGGVKEARTQSEIGTAIITALVEGSRNRPGLDLSAPACLVEVMLAKEEAGEITADMTRDLCMDLLITGTDTSAQTVNWTLLLLANRPEIQARVHEELDRVVGPDARPTVDDRIRLPYTFACLAESMRYRTIGPLAVPHKASEETEVGGYRIPAGAQVLGNIYSVHHDPRFWESPHEYIPERFLPQSDGSPSPALTGNAFIPFGTGHRRCPGRRFAEMTVWLHVTRMLHRLRFETPGGNPLPEDETFGLSISPNPYRLRATQRWSNKEMAPQ
ncbi:MAG: cytochrome P450 [Chloroflexota bacterium]|nr:cytochrome P450 [Chloroflexota bacterium]